jgi:Carboxypeptidase regulatory-like domain
MRSHLVLRLIVASTSLFLWLPLAGYAQDISVSALRNGTVTDSSGGVLPAVTVRAVHEATGNVFEVVTDERGVYRLPVRVGGLRVTGELSGFRPATRSVELLVGQTAVVNDVALLPGTPKYKPEFLAKVKELDDNQVNVDPAFTCGPPGVPRIGPPQRIVQTAREVVLLYDDLNGNFSPHSYRRPPASKGHRGVGSR